MIAGSTSLEQAVARMTRVSGVRAAGLCSYDGINIVSRTAAGTQGEDELAAMSAQMGSVAAALLQATEGGGLRTAAFETANGRLVIADVDRGYLVAVADPSANMGLLWLVVEQAARQLREDLAPEPADA